MNDAAKAPGREGEKPRGGLFYKLALASVGSVKLAQEEISSFFRRAPEPRDPSEPEGEPLPLEASPEAEHRIDSTINRVLDNLSIASRDDVQALQAEVQALQGRVAALKAQRG